MKPAKRVNKQTKPERVGSPPARPDPEITAPSIPQRFLKARVKEISGSLPTLLGLCAGYEQGRWRARAFAEHLINWLPDFCLTYSELQNFGPHNAVSQIRAAAQKVYSTDDFKRRGEFGEVMLHVIARQELHSLPAVCKVYYKTSSNETVKGFDLVHIIPDGADLKLLLGEAKFYSNATEAIRAAIKSLKDHFEPSYVRTEFIFLTGKIDSDWPYAAKLKTLLDPATSLDDVFKVLTVPVLITYDSATLQKYNEESLDLECEFKSEIKTLEAQFRAEGYPSQIEILLCLVPLASKQVLASELDRELSKWKPTS